MTKPTVLKFRLKTKDYVKFFMGTMNKLNEKEWMGKEPRSCKIKDIKQKQPVAVGDYAEFDITVEHKPKGCITFDKGGFWYDGWTLKHIDVMRDGTLLDGKGQPLPAGADPVFLGWRVYDETDFNNHNFGEFLGEEACDASKPTRKFMWRFADMPTMTTETVVKRFPHLFENKDVWHEGMGEPYPEAEVEVVNGEIESIPDDAMTYWVSGDPVELPPTPCLASEWEKWFTEFRRTHPHAHSEDGTFAKNVRHGANGMCFVIVPKE